MKILGIDVGGSGLKGAPVDTVTGRQLAERHKVEIESPCPPAKAAAAAAEIARHFNWKGPIGMGFPGVVCGSEIMATGNLGEAWIGIDGVKVFSKATGCPVRMVNDADAAGLAEMRFGAGKGQMGSVLMITAGTGIGSAMFYRGVLFPNTEFGHIKRKGKSVEKYCAASVREKKELSWEEWAGRLSTYLQMMEALTWPELIIIGGGVSGKAEKWLHFVKTRAKVVPAKLGNAAGIIGAALAGEPRPR